MRCRSRGVLEQLEDAATDQPANRGGGNHPGARSGIDDVAGEATVTGVQPEGKSPGGGFEYPVEVSNIQ